MRRSNRQRKPFPILTFLAVVCGFGFGMIAWFRHSEVRPAYYEVSIWRETAEEAGGAVAMREAMAKYVSGLEKNSLTSGNTNWWIENEHGSLERKYQNASEILARLDAYNELPPEVQAESHALVDIRTAIDRLPHYIEWAHWDALHKELFILWCVLGVGSLLCGVVAMSKN